MTLVIVYKNEKEKVKKLCFYTRDYLLTSKQRPKVILGQFTFVNNQKAR